MLVVTAVCIGVKVAAAIVTPVLPGLIVMVCVGGILLWAVGKR